MNVDCAAELHTHHFDAHRSKGVVADAEVLLTAALDDGHVGANGKLNPTAFPAKKLKRNEASIARLQYTSRQDFKDHVISPAVSRGGQFLGVASVVASKVREIRSKSFDGARECRSFCILDVVNRGDHDGHAVISFSEGISNLTTNAGSLGIIRTAAIEELVDRFSELLTLDDIYGVGI